MAGRVGLITRRRALALLVTAATGFGLAFLLDRLVSVVGRLRWRPRRCRCPPPKGDRPARERDP